MTAEKYTTKKGRTLYRPVLSLAEAEVTMLDRGPAGFCLACGLEVESGVEPDARKYPCESCGEPMVYGLEELLLMGVALVDGERTV